jgi:DNA-binding CsgD family transcriptional regulator
LSIPESAVYFLKREGLNTKKIAEILGKDYKTIWTIARRAEIKNAQQI